MDQRLLSAKKKKKPLNILIKCYLIRVNLQKPIFIDGGLFEFLQLLELFGLRICFENVLQHMKGM